VRRAADGSNVERAELARLRGDDGAWRGERREAERLFTAMGATARAAEMGGVG
jgi:hypothetical protein